MNERLYTVLLEDAEGFASQCPNMSEAAARGVVRWMANRSDGRLVAVMEEHAPDVLTFVSPETLAAWSVWQVA